MRDYSFRYHQGQPPPRKKSRFLIIVFIVATIIFGSFMLRKPSVSNDIPNFGKKSVADLVNTEIPNLLSQEPGVYTIYIYDIQNNIGYGIGEKTTMTAASVNKVPILATLYHLAGIGEIDLERTVVTQKEDIQDYGTGSIRYEEPGKTYSVKTLARLMMQKSDNTAAYILSTHILGVKKIQELTNSWGLIQTNIEKNSSSPSDMGLLLLKMYKGEITNQALTLEMLEFMTNSDFEDRIPTGVPHEVEVYHKTGDEVAKIHDVGIIDKKGHPYILAIFTSEMSDNERTKRIMAEISRKVYTAF
ncbi:serine hydrolase [Candidatus Gottesmanbacteria bacterium]|nr:serine hydrolase [Candidatus Gottesmanbacteria bacterium]